MSQFIWGALLMILLVGVVQLFPKRGNRVPISERVCAGFRRFGQWNLDVATAWDVAICEYRNQRSFQVHKLKSTQDREAIVKLERESLDLPPLPVLDPETASLPDATDA